jgi:hypothetical protein
MSRIPPRSISKARQNAIDRSDRINDVVGRVFAVTGEVGVRGPGEVVQQVSFPVRFIERPVVTFGAGVEGGQCPVANSFPRCDAVVVNWLTEGEENRLLFRGARIAVHTSGPDEQVLFIGYRMEGKALVNPITRTDGDSLQNGDVL